MPPQPILLLHIRGAAMALTRSDKQTASPEPTRRCKTLRAAPFAAPNRSTGGAVVGTRESCCGKQSAKSTRTCTIRFGENVVIPAGDIQTARTWMIMAECAQQAKAAAAQFTHYFSWNRSVGLKTAMCRIYPITISSPEGEHRQSLDRSNRGLKHCLSPRKRPADRVQREQDWPEKDGLAPCYLLRQRSDPF